MSGGYLWFIARMAEILAWPTTVLLSIWLLRGQVFQLLKNLRSLKYKDMEIVFREGLDRAQDELNQNANKLPQQAGGSQRVEPPANLFFKFGGFEQLLQVSPNAAVIEAWSYLERALVELAQKHQYGGRPNARQVVEYLQRKEVLPESLANALQQLGRLRNIAAHAPGNEPIPRIEALRYKVIASDSYQVLASLIAK